MWSGEEAMHSQLTSIECSDPSFPIVQYNYYTVLYVYVEGECEIYYLLQNIKYNIGE